MFFIQRYGRIFFCLRCVEKLLSDLNVFHEYETYSAIELWNVFLTVSPLLVISSLFGMPFASPNWWLICFILFGSCVISRSLSLSCLDWISVPFSVIPWYSVQIYHPIYQNDFFKFCLPHRLWVSWEKSYLTHFVSTMSSSVIR